MNVNSTTFNPKDLWYVAVRRKWLIAASIVVSLGIAWVVCVITPKSFRSNTLIMVDNQKIPENYVHSVVGGSVSERIVTIQQQVLSRTVLSSVIDEFDLYHDAASGVGREAAIEGMRKKIKVETKGGPGVAHVDAFSIAFSHNDPVIAQKVTAKLASQFIDQNLRSREQLVQGTTEFLTVELERAAGSLEEQEKAIAIFKKKHMGELPGQTDANLHMLSRLQRESTTLSETLQNRIDRRMGLQKMISAYETMGLALLDAPRGSGLPQVTSDDLREGRAPRQAVPRGESAVMGGVTSGGDPLAVRLRELERTLSSLSAEYKDTYPDVIQVKHEIQQIKQKLAEKRASGPNEKDAVGAEGGRAETGKKVTSVMDPYLHELKKERDENEIGISSLTEQLHKVKGQVEEYERRVERAPEREQELTVLQRDYDNTKKNYQTLLEKQLNARISENLEHRQKGETFRVLDPANVPSSPESPDQVRIMLVGLLVGIGGGYGLAFLLEQMAGVFRRPEDAESVLGLPVLATIPDFTDLYQRGISRKVPALLYRPRLKPREMETSEDATSIGRGDYGVQKYPKTLGALSYQSRPSEVEKKLASQSLSNGGDRKKLELNLVSRWLPQSLVAEQFRVAATRVVLSGRTDKSTVVVVTSSIKGEGKSVTASNLAYVMAHDLGKKTVLVDCDFKQPMVDAYTGVPAKPGLAELIYGDASLDGSLHQLGDDPLWVLPSGRRDHRLVDLTKLPQLSSLIDQLRERFDFIIVDAPPVLPLADMNLLAEMADMLLIVVRAEMTSQGIVQSAMKSLKHSGRAGIIMTASKYEVMPRYAVEQYAASVTEYLK